MAATEEHIVELARAELGTVEYPPNSNNVKYNTEYYGREVSGSSFAWCAVFIWWLFREAGLSALYFGGQKTAYVPALLTWARKEKLAVEEPRPGDLVCFEFDGDNGPDHVGLCESWDGTYVTTIDGNTGTGSEVNGGAVMRRRRHKKYISAVIRPKYEEREDEEVFDPEKLTDEQLLRLAERIDKARGQKEPNANWGEEARNWGREEGLISGNEHGAPLWEAYVTRNQLVTILYKFYKLLSKTM